MAIILSESIIPAIPETTKLFGSTTFEVNGKKLIIKCGDEEKIFDERPPAGKKWNVSLILDITEVND